MGSAVGILKLTKVNRAFPGAKALTGAGSTMREGEVLVLVGEDETGKSTLMKILSGAYKKGSGTIEFEGRGVEIHLPKQSEELGISIVYQELNLTQRVTVAENVFLGRYPIKTGAIQWEKMGEDAKKLFDNLGVEMDVQAMLRELSLVQRQIMEIVKAISINTKVIIMDEPVSSLSHNETEILFRIVRMLKKRGIAVTFITYRLDEIYIICDRMTILRDGCYIGTREAKEVTKADMIKMIIGRQLIGRYPQRDTRIGETALGVRGLSDGGKWVKEVSFAARSGEVLGFAGPVGAGRTETMRTIFGVDKRAKGEIFTDGKQMSISSPKDAIDMGIGFVTENRKEEGLFLCSSVKVNTVTVALKKILKADFYFDFRKEKQVAEEYVKLLRAATPSVEQRVIFLNDGNQQRVVLAKWLFSDPKIIILNEPIRGIGVGAKHEIYEIISKLVSEGETVTVMSSDLEEIMGIYDRTPVIHEGVVSGEVEEAGSSQSKIIEYVVGGS